MFQYIFLFICLSRTMVNMKASSAVYDELNSRSGQINDLNIGICCFSTKQTTLQVKNNDQFSWSQEQVSEQMTCQSLYFCFKCANKIKLQLVFWSSRIWIPSSSHLSVTCSRHHIAGTNGLLSISVKQKSITILLKYCNSQLW